MLILKKAIVKHMRTPNVAVAEELIDERFEPAEYTEVLTRYRKIMADKYAGFEIEFILQTIEE